MATRFKLFAIVIIASFFLAANLFAVGGEEFSFDKKRIYVDSYRYRVSMQTPNVIEGILLSISNNTIMHLKSFKYRVTVKDPRGKVLYKEVLEYGLPLPCETATSYLQARTGEYWIYPERFIKSAFQIALDHVTSIEVLSVNMDKIITAENIATIRSSWAISDSKFLYAHSEEDSLRLLKMYKTIFELNPDFIKTSKERDSSREFLKWEDAEYFLDMYDYWINHKQYLKR